MDFSKTTPQFHTPKKYLRDLVDLFQWPPSEWIKVRLLGPVTSFSDTWIRIKTKGGKVVPVQKLTLDHDPSTDKYVRNDCPYRAAGLAMRKTYLVNAIIRNLQENEPKSKISPLPDEGKKRKVLPWDEYRAPCKTMGSKSWTPIRVLRIPQGLASKLKDLVELNKHQGKKMELTDLNYGIDLSILFDPTGFWGLPSTKRRTHQTNHRREELPPLQISGDETRELERRPRTMATPQGPSGRGGGG